MRPGTRRGWQVVGVCAWSAGVLLTHELRSRLTGHSRPKPSGPAQLRRALERLGPTFMKLGQVLSTRPDLLSPAYEAELAMLQDAAPPVPWSEVRASLDRALGAPPEEPFRRLSATPLAAASIGQVHAGRLADGTDIVVKVRRPGVVEQVDVDLALIDAASRALAHLPIVRRFDPVGLAHEFATTLRRELDYTLEAANAERLHAELSSMQGVEVPTVVWNLTTESVLTETRIFGAKIDDMTAIDALALDRPAVARRFADAYLKMVFVHRFFHADPHPGNVFVKADGTVAFVDFGMVGEVDEAIGDGLVAVLGALVSADAADLAAALLHLGIAGIDADRAGLERDLDALLTTYRDQRLEDLHLARLVADLMGVVRAGTSASRAASRCCSRRSSCVKASPLSLTRTSGSCRSSSRTRWHSGGVTRPQRDPPARRAELRRAPAASLVPRAESRHSAFEGARNRVACSQPTTGSPIWRA